MTTRTDTHRPSVLDPADYRDVGYLDYGGYDDPGDFYLDEEYRSRPYFNGTGEPKCDHCGQRIRYGEIFYHKPSNELVVVGLTCAGTLGLTSVHEKEMKRQAEFRKLAKVRGHRLAGDPQAQRAAYWMMDVRFAAEDTWARENEIEREFKLDREDDRSFDTADWKAINAAKKAAYRERLAATGIDGKMEAIVLDMQVRFNRYGDLSDKQVAFLLRLRAQAQETRVKQAAFALDRESAADCPDRGRITVEGEVLKSEWRDNDYGGKLVWTVKTDEGWLVWGTVPSSMGNPERGDRVRFSAEVTPSGDDPKFGFYKRPTKAEYLEEVAR